MHTIALFHNILFYFNLKLCHEEIRLVIQPDTKAIFSPQAVILFH